ncbi:hypothetical protein [Roseobacter sp. GAI101]|uniref:hypothetical protein n=1 Tax=Roseobacter sp. (strain GAI101) TaxID=391589 RepID=UPI0018DE175E|nr:hypothetical protein [Roseobacter sp. GAI101]
MTSPEVGREIVSLARYDPGTRGLSPTTRAGNFGSISMAEHIKSQDARCAVIAMIEDAEALDRIDEQQDDATFIGGIKSWMTE